MTTLGRARTAVACVAVLGAVSSVWRPALAQDSTAIRATINPGMSPVDVIQRLGQPIAERLTDARTYYYYDAGCTRPGCSESDVVIFEHGVVADAIFHSGQRTFSGGTGPATVLPSVVRSHHTTAALPAIHASSSADSTRRGGVVFAGPRPVERPTAEYRAVRPSGSSAIVPSATPTAPAPTPASAPPSSPPPSPPPPPPAAPTAPSR